jgi:hypothetical protein
MEQVTRLYGHKDFGGRVKIEAGNEPMISVKLKTTDVLGEATAFVRAYRAAQKEGKNDEKKN